ncbi:unnamed protein product, partial [Rotaria magnacalcarata]
MKSCVSSSSTSNQIDVISLMGTTNQNSMNLSKTSNVVSVSSNNHDDFLSIKSSNEQVNDSS